MRTRRLVAMLAAGALTVPALALPSVAVTSDELRSAWVPAMCVHPAGYLVDGELPEDDDPLNGGVWLGRTVTGPLTADGDAWGVAQITCSAGGVGWPDSVAFYEPSGEFHRAFDLYDITRGGRETIAKISLAKRRVSVRVAGIAQNGDTACCGTRSAVLTFRWSAGKERIVLSGKRTYDERKTARRLVKAVNLRNGKQVRKLTSRGMARTLLSMRRWQDSRFQLRTCFGELDQRFPFGYDVDRGCLVRVKNRLGSYTYVLGMDQRGWRTWKVTDGSYA